MRLTWRRPADGAVCPRVERETDYHYIAGEFTQKVYNKLCEYEDAEEQGLLVRLPCKVGTPVYFIKKTGFYPELIETRIDEIGVRHGGMFIKLSCNSMYRTAMSAWGKTVFLSREEAEAALKGEMEDV